MCILFDSISVSYVIFISNFTPPDLPNLKQSCVYINKIRSCSPGGGGCLGEGGVEGAAGEGRVEGAAGEGVEGTARGRGAEGRVERAPQIWRI